MRVSTYYFQVSFFSSQDNLKKKGYYLGVEIYYIYVSAC